MQAEFPRPGDLLGDALALTVLPAPALAQKDHPTQDQGLEALAALAQAFPVEPLTAEQQGYTE